jgi:hypothetical protein
MGNSPVAADLWEERSWTNLLRDHSASVK